MEKLIEVKLLNRCVSDVFIFCCFFINAFRYVISVFCDMDNKHFGDAFSKFGIKKKVQILILTISISKCLKSENKNAYI